MACMHTLGGSTYSRNIFLTASKLDGGVTGRPETMCPRTKVLGPLVPKLIVPCDTMSQDLYIPVIMHYTKRFG